MEISQLKLPRCLNVITNYYTIFNITASATNNEVGLSTTVGASAASIAAQGTGYSTVILYLWFPNHET
jgi:hypothetical protein